MKLFHYDSKLMQTLMFIGDLMILNVLYLICCLPVFTIGAAQAGLFTAVRVLNNPEDDSSAAAAFFKGFRSGFGKVTLGWGLVALLSVIMAVTWYFCKLLEVGDLQMAPTWMAAVAFCITALFHPLTTLFHSHFDCKPMQLIRNSWFMLVAHPLRSLAVAALFWLPFVFFMVDPFTFMSVGMLWLVLYYAVAALFSDLLTRKPFQVLIENFNENNKPEAVPQTEEIEEPARETEEV